MIKNNRRAQIEALVKQGFTTPEIAEMIFTKETNVRYHLTFIYAKYGVTRQCELVARMWMGEERFKSTRNNPDYPKLRSVA